MGRKSPNTTNSTIKAALHRLWLHSRERAATVKRDEYTCQVCKGKQSRRKGHEFKVQVHHINGVKWGDMIRFIRDNLLVSPDDMITLCKSCHLTIHKQEKKA